MSTVKTTDPTPDEVAISVDGIAKYFEPSKGQRSVKQAFTSALNPRKEAAQSKGGYWALKDISFKVKKGEFFGIVGRNGSGKSTLLKMMAGVYTPTKGQIEVNGLLVPFIELGVGFNAELTGKDNVFLNGALLGFDRSEMLAMYDDIVSFAELENHMDVKLKNFSSGMQVRLAFSIAIRAKSEILLIDEVLAVGDAAFQRKCFDYFMQIKKEKRTMVLVTHDMGAVRRYCDRAIMIDKGKVVERGDPEKIAQAYQKLFTDEIDQQQTVDAKGTLKSTSDRRWGTGKLRADRPKITVTKESVTIKTAYTAFSDLEPPVLGFTIYGPSGNNILEGNTLRKLEKTPALKKGGMVGTTWTIPNIFATGTYEVAVACCDNSTTEFYDWFNESGSFIISKQGDTAGTVDPDLGIALN